MMIMIKKIEKLNVVGGQIIHPRSWKSIALYHTGPFDEQNKDEKVVPMAQQALASTMMWPSH